MVVKFECDIKGENLEYLKSSAAEHRRTLSEELSVIARMALDSKMLQHNCWKQRVDCKLLMSMVSSGGDIYKPPRIAGL